jgi:hypothetical protein
MIKHKKVHSLAKIGLIQLRKAISMLEFIIQNESIESVKISYEEKIKELKGRLKNREEGKEVGNYLLKQHKT